MPRFEKDISKKSGMPPGTLLYTGKRGTEEVKIEIIDYTDAKLQEKTTLNVEECFPFKAKPTITWINITGIHKTGIIEKIGKHFEFHPLILEDIVNPNQRPKLEDFESHLFIVLKMLSYDEKNKEIKSEQLSLILGSNFLISFQEDKGDVFDQVRQRIRSGKGKIRKMGTDYLCYALIDAVVDNYFVILEKKGEEIESIEDDVIDNPSPKLLNTISRLKSQLIVLRRSVWPLREVISGLQRRESKLIKKSTEIYLRDVYDHTVRIIETIETYRDMVSGMIDIHISSVSNKMNEVMKVLTIIATIFIPLTFIVGIYGMNFNYMPELGWKPGYFMVWGVMLAVGIFMVFYFRRKKWI